MEGGGWYTFQAPLLNAQPRLAGTLSLRRLHLWFADHFLPPPVPTKLWPTEEHITCFDGFTLIAVAAGMTEKLRLGGLVMGNTYRNPALVAKMATTLDQASKGRFTLGLGSAWFRREHEAYG